MKPQENKGGRPKGLDIKDELYGVDSQIFWDAWPEYTINDDEERSS